ncbi:MAG: hypothetical protein M1325_01095 [Actinobacteria bacterium]|nr:hypothetical protein [Actinomycetota bacterium]
MIRIWPSLSQGRAMTLGALSDLYEARGVDLYWRAEQSLRLSRMRRAQPRPLPFWPVLVIVVALLIAALWGPEAL